MQFGIIAATSLMLSVSLASHAPAHENKEAVPVPPKAMMQGKGGTQTAQAWILDLFGPSYAPSPRGPRWSADPPQDQVPPPSYGERPVRTFRTLCVRLCDGFRTPVSFATIPSRFQQDAERCERSCPNRSRLFTLSSGSEDYAGMTDLKGRPYSALQNAFRHVKEYIPDCSCHGNPWDEAALARHRAYAAAGQDKQKSDRKLTSDRSAGGTRTSEKSSLRTTRTDH